VKAVSVSAILLCALLASCVCSRAETDPFDVWQQRVNPAGINPKSLACGNGTFVGIGTNRFLLASPDGTNWTQFLSPPIGTYSCVIFGAGSFYAAGYYTTTIAGSGFARDYLTPYIMQSADALNWMKVYDCGVISNSIASDPLRAGAYGNNRLVFVGNSIITTTLTPTNWTEIQLPVSMSLSGATYGMGRFVVSGKVSSPAESFILSSADGAVWRYDYGPKTNDSSSGVAYGNGVFVAPWSTNGAADSGFLISTNLSSWSYVPLIDQGINAPGPVLFGGGQFIASLGGRTYTSPDGLSWTYRAAVSNSTAFAYGKGTFFTSTLQQSDVFSSSTSPPPSNLALTLFAGLLITGTEGETFRIEYTTNLPAGTNWLMLTNFTLPYSPCLWIDTTAPAQSQRFYRAVQIE
jgi:hypothetical protein